MDAVDTLPIVTGANGVAYRSRYRLARLAPYWRVEEWRRGLLGLGAAKWREVDWGCLYLERTIPDAYLAYLRALEADARRIARFRSEQRAATWQPVEEP